MSVRKICVRTALFSHINVFLLLSMFVFVRILAKSLPYSFPRGEEMKIFNRRPFDGFFAFFWCWRKSCLQTKDVQPDEIDSSRQKGPSALHREARVPQQRGQRWRKTTRLLCRLTKCGQITRRCRDASRLERRWTRSRSQK